MTSKPRVLCLVDVPGWTFDFYASSVRRELQDQFEIEIAYTSQRPVLYPDRIDVLMAFAWSETYHQRFGFDPRMVIKDISSHRWLYQDEYAYSSSEEVVFRYLLDCNQVFVPSLRLYNEFRDLVPHCVHAPNGFDEGRFRDCERHNPQMVIGYAGNSADPYKGFALLHEACQGRPYVLRGAGGRLTHDAMPAFYQGIDVFACSSNYEGEPYTLIEAMACGCFPVATDVGIVPELIRHGENGLIVERTAAAFRKAFDWCLERREQVRAVLGDAVRDRLRTDRVGVFMSGGLDSTAVAATARRLLQEQGRPFDLRAYTLVYDRLIPDEERHYAGLTAEALGIPIHYQSGDEARPFAGWRREDGWPPEPIDEPLTGNFFAQLEQVLPHSRVVLTGQGGDALFRPEPFLVDLLKKGRWLRWLREVGGYFRAHGKLPPLGLRTQWQRWRGRGPTPYPYPPWLRPEFAARLGLRRRWEAETRAPAEEPNGRHPTHPTAARDLRSPYWVAVCEGLNPGVTGHPVEFRHPLLDVRVVEFVLAVPPMPWCVDKELLRASMKGFLREVVRLRRKTLLRGNPLAEILHQGGAGGLGREEALAHVRPYVDVQRVLAGLGAADALGEDPYDLFRPLCLNHWLGSLTKKALKTPLEKVHALCE
jgi:hypothetical protein